MNPSLSQHPPGSAYIPQPKQAMLHACPADIAFYGGAAGSGKTIAMVAEAMRGFRIPGYSAVIFRRTSPELTGGGSIWEEARAVYPRFGGDMREHRLDVRFPSGAMIEFRHLQYDKDKHTHHGKQYSLIIFEELTQFLLSQFWYMLSRNRTACAVLPYIRASLNPDPDHFARAMIDWWIGPDGYAIPERSGVIRWFVRDTDNDKLHWADTKQDLLERFPLSLPVSFTFIAANLDDNPALLRKDPTYRSKLMMLDKVERERLLYSNWNIRPAAGLYFQRDYFRKLTTPLDMRDVVKKIRYWDLAATEPSSKNSDPDYTRGILYYKLRNGRTVLADGASVRGGPEKVRRLLLRTAAQDGKDTKIWIPQDPGQAGKDQRETYAKILSGFSLGFEVVRKNKVIMAGPFSSAAENGLVDYIDGEWWPSFVAEAESFPDGPHDDWIDAAGGAHRRISKGLDGVPSVSIAESGTWD